MQPPRRIVIVPLVELYLVVTGSIDHLPQPAPGVVLVLGIVGSEPIHHRVVVIPIALVLRQLPLGVGGAVTESVYSPLTLSSNCHEEL